MADLFGRTLGDFILREQIGEGGYAVVHRCEQPPLERDVVIKVLHARRCNDLARERFLREAQLASRLDHPYAAHVYAFGAEHDGLLWLAMELVQGVTLGDWLEQHGPMPLGQFVPFFECVAQVVQAAHDRGVVHRDLKPSNMMVIERGGRLFPKLLDFGIAKVSGEEPEPVAPADAAVTARLRIAPQRVQRTRTDSHEYRLTRTGTGMGSAPYMSPEQWSDAGAVGPASDIYSLGVLAYEALTGRRPFRASTAEAYYWEHLRGEMPALDGELEPGVDRILRRALAKDPGARHASVLELAAELGAALRAQPREQLRSLAQVWNDRARSPALLLKSKELLGAPIGVIGELERAFVVASRRHVQRRALLRRLWIAVGAALAVGAVWYRGQLETELAEQRTRAAQRLAEVTVTQSELEQGRQALLHGEPDALHHLAEAYRRDPAPATAFMLARAMQPRLAEQARFASSSGRMWSAAFSPDGASIVTTDDRNAQIWDADTRRLRFTLPHGEVVYQAAYTADGARLVTAAGDGAVRIWDAARGRLIRELRGGATQLRYYLVALSPDGRLVAATEGQGKVTHVWDAATGAPIAEIHSDGLESAGLAFSGDGRWLAATGGNDVRVIDARTWQLALVIHGPRIHRLAFDPTGPRLVTGSTTGDVAVWDVPGGERLRHLREFGEPVDAVAFSPDGRLVAASSRDGAEQVWRTESGELQSQLGARHARILGLEFDRASQYVLAVGADGVLIVADAALGVPIAMLEGSRNVVTAHFDPSGRRVIGASLDGTARIWDARSPYRRWSSPPVSDNCGVVTSAEPDSRFIALGCRDRGTQVWDTARDRLLAELPSASRVDGDFTSALPTVSSDGGRAAIARGDAVEVYELPGGRLVRRIVHRAPVNAVAFAGTGRDIVSGAIDGSLLVARDSGALLALPTATAGIDTVGILGDGRTVATDARRRLRIYDPTGAVEADLEMPGRAMSLRIDGARLITVPSYTGSAAPPLLVDTAHHRVVAELAGHVGRVVSARWVSGGRILTAGGDATARLWDGATGRPLQVFRGSTRLLSDATIGPDDLVIAGGGDGLLRFWDAPSGRLLWALAADKSWLVGVHVEGDDIITRGFNGELSRWTLPKPLQVIGACSDHDRCRS